MYIQNVDVVDGPDNLNGRYTLANDEFPDNSVNYPIYRSGGNLIHKVADAMDACVVGPGGTLDLAVSALAGVLGVAVKTGTEPVGVYEIGDAAPLSVRYTELINLVYDTSETLYVMCFPEDDTENYLGFYNSEIVLRTELPWMDAAGYAFTIDNPIRTFYVPTGLIPVFYRQQASDPAVTDPILSVISSTGTGGGPGSLENFSDVDTFRKIQTS